MREEQAIFDELARLCTSPGYVHALAYFCIRDNMVPYAGEMTAQDMQHLFSKERLIRTETSTLIGLLIKENIDYALPAPSVTQQYITQTEALLEEMHRAMLQEWFGGLNVEEFLNKEINPFDRGAALREPIFYGGESAFCFQYRDLSPRKYAADSQWLEANKGFSIQSAWNVVNALATLQADKLSDLIHTIRRSHPNNWTMLPGFSFTAHELASAAGMDRALVDKVLTAFTVPLGENNQGFHALHDFNAANATPLLRAPDETFVLFQQYSLAEALYESPFYWMISDRDYVDLAMLHRGRFTEEFARERLELVFGKEKVYSNVDVYERKDKRIGEIDVLVIFGDRAIVLQAKSKRLTLEARRGNDNQIKDDFRKSVQESYNQGYECAKLLRNTTSRFIDAGGQVLTVPQELKEIYIVCLVSDHYPALSFQARQFLKFQSTEAIRPPFVIDIFTLDVMTEMLESPLWLLSYINRRTGYFHKVLASHELIILAYHLMKNLWLEDDYDMVAFEDGISADLDVAMCVRRDNIPGKRTPDGILTCFAETALGRLVKEIEARPDPATIDFGFMLLTLSEHAIVNISNAIETTARKVREDGNNHDVTISLSKIGTGLIVHCNDEPISFAGPRLERHCAGRKYTERASKWYGICVRPSDMSLRFGVTLNYTWEPNAGMEAATRHLRKPGRLANVVGGARKSKIGRNEACPCGSGLKYKQCCLK